MPAVFLPLAAFMGFRDEKMVAILIMLGAPTTVSCYIMSRNMGHEGVLSSSCVVSTTFLSSVFITLWLFLLRNFGLI
jgi:predicted permease